MYPKFVIVIGTSAGGLSALSKLLTQFEKGMDAAICIVIHLSPAANINFVTSHLQSFTRYIAVLFPET